MGYENSNLIKDIYSLTPSQQGILYHHLLESKSQSYISQDVFSVNQKLQEHYIKSVLYCLVNKYSVLKTSIIYKQISKPRQVVLKNRKIEYERIKFEEEDEKRQDELLAQIIGEDINRGFDLLKDSLLRVKWVTLGAKDYMVWTSDHIILDGWSSSIIIKDFIRYYNMLQNRDSTNNIEEIMIKEKKKIPEFRIYIDWIYNQEKSSAAEYWKNLVKDYDAIAEIHRMRIPAKSDKQVERLEVFLTEELTQQLTELAVRNNTTINNVAEAAWGIVLQRYNDTNDVIFGKVISGRDVSIIGIEDMVGLCINTIPIRVRTNETTTVGDLLKELKEQGLESKRYGYYPLVEIQSETKQKSDFIKTLFVFENFYKGEDNKSPQAGLEFQYEKNREQTNYLLTVNVAIRDHRLRLSIKYNPSIYVEDEVKRVLDHLAIIMKEMVNARTKVEDIEMIIEQDRKAILTIYNNTDAGYPKEKTIIDLFEEQVLRTPDNIAVIYENKKLTYKKLNRTANKLARMLKEYDVQPNDYVALYMDYCCEMMVCIYGVLKAGAAYLPISLNYPEERIKYVLNDSNPKVVITYNTKINTEIPVIDLCHKKIEMLPANNLEKISKPEDFIYCMYTSGTTGFPKGIPVKNRMLVNLSTWYADRFEMDQNTKNLIISPISFDLTQRNIFGIHITGGVTYMCGSECVFDSEQILFYIEKNKISMINCAVSAFYSILYQSKMGAYRQLSSLKKIYLGGEAVSLKKIKPFLHNHSEVEVVNGYGVTEDSGVATHYTITEKDKEYIRVPIGKPINNKKIFILSKNRLCGVGVPGEICITGIGVTDGYLNHQEFTQKKFLDCLYCDGKMYHTGDQGRWLPNGNIEFLGRMDNQIKIRGLRIELGEIERTLRRIDIIIDCVVTVKKQENGEEAICAYLVSNQDISQLNIREILKKSLPEYMMPLYIGQIEKIPITRNGKVDKLALPNLELNTNETYIEPMTKKETDVVRILEQVLNIKKIGMNDNIFELGANSINIMIIVNRLKQSSYKISVSDIMRSYSVTEIVKNINKAMKINHNLISRKC